METNETREFRQLREKYEELYRQLIRIQSQIESELGQTGNIVRILHDTSIDRNNLRNRIEQLYLTLYGGPGIPGLEAVVENMLKDYLSTKSSVRKYFWGLITAICATLGNIFWKMILQFFNTQ